MATRSQGRHRAACRPKTPFDDIAKNLSSPSGVRAVVAATGTGLAFTAMATSGAVAAPDVTAATVDVAQLTTKASAQVTANPTVVADAEEANPWEDSAASVETKLAVHSPRFTGTVPDAPPGSVLEVAYRYLGVPYVWGASSPSGFDCSGFTQYVYRQVGINLPRTSREQGAATPIISASEAKPGDLVHWSGHVAIYIGNGMIIHAAGQGRHIEIGPLYGSYTFHRVG